MKHISYISKVCAPVFIGLAVLMAGCNDLLTQPEPAQTTPETPSIVNVRIQIAGDSNPARTLLPTAPTSFTSYTLTWRKDDEQDSNPVSKPPEQTINTSESIPLGVGTWTITARAMVALDSATQAVAAEAVRTFKIVPQDHTFDNATESIPCAGSQAADTGKLDIFYVNSSGNGITYPDNDGDCPSSNPEEASVKIVLKSGGIEGKGRFDYDITFYSGNFEEAGLQLFKIDDNKQVSSTPVSNVSLTNPLPTTPLAKVSRQTTDSTASGYKPPLLLDAGYYLLKITMNRRIVMSEAVHILSGLTTKTTSGINGSDRKNYTFYDAEVADETALRSYLSGAADNTPETPYYVKLRGGVSTSASPLPPNKFVYLNLEAVSVSEPPPPIMLTDCQTLVGVALPTTMPSIADEMFKGCTALAFPVAIPSSVKSIGKSAFEGCAALTSVTFYETAESSFEIKPSAFKGCTALASVTFPTVTAASSEDTSSSLTIGHHAFENCSTLEVNFPRPTTSPNEPLTTLTIGVDAFKGTGTSYVDLSGYTIKGYTTEPPQTEPPQTEPPPATDNIISAGAFQNSGLGQIIFPTSITQIGNFAFDSCSSLITVTLPDNVTNIGNYAFRRCTQLGNINFPSALKTIGTQAFKETRLPRADLSSCNSLNDIGNGAFSDCSNLSQVSLPDPNHSEASHADFYIDSSAFLNCRRLQRIDLPDYVAEIRSHAFEGCTSLSEVWCLQTLSPPTLGGAGDEFPATATIYVQQSLESAYRSPDSPWAGYHIELDPNP